ncbi:HlyC/CorC family transporter [Ramlibacter sp. USB13]|uniref:Polyamine export protein n=1 Tax=Ramlibacter cellulosilyticus TaxID=2764187 RepID=A0A923MKY7_9BURK|nr:hemolysin family protein [Ramlibacter cellulosilyticus]MBC5781430.1 HlyC/CorC family transporter [Ramlibacter cellulosilyticus]
MGPGAELLVILLLIACSAFFSVAEIALASSRRLRLRQLADQGDARAERVLAVQEQPGNYFTVVQIAQNMLAILAGVVGDGVLSPLFTAALVRVLPAANVAPVASVLSFAAITTGFILFADLFPRRLAMAEPERLAIRVLRPMHWFTGILRPVVWVFKRTTDVLMRAAGVPERRHDQITSADILAMTAAGAKAGVLHAREQQVIENLFELDTRIVESAMTPRQHVVYFLASDDEAGIRARIAQEPHSTYLVCDGDIDRVVGYVDTADLFARMVRQQPIRLQGEESQGLLRKALFIPDRLTLSEVLGEFRQAHEDFAVIVNEYSLVLGVITLNDVMSTVMGSLVGPQDEEQIVRRDDGSWLMDGMTPVGDVLRALGADGDTLPQRGQYDTLAGLMMALLRRMPRRTDRAEWGGFRFEVLDVDSLRIDQVLVTPVATTDEQRRAQP